MNQLVATWLARAPAAEGPFAVRSVQLGPDGVDIAGDLTHPQASGPAAWRLTVEAPAPGRFSLRVAPTALPPNLAPEVAAYRDVLERLKIHVDLDFTGSPAAAVPEART